VTGLGLLVRWAHLAGGIVLTGTFTLLVLAGRPVKPTARRWDREALALARAALLVTLLAGAATLVLQVMALEGRPGAALEPAAIGRALATTRFGAVWLVRHGLLLLLLPFLSLRVAERSDTDRMALRGQGLLLASLAFGAAAWGGHSAAVEPRPTLAASIDALHLVMAGAWVGGLPALARLAWLSSRRDGADARPFAVLAVRRFSVLALGAVLVIAASGTVNAWNHVGSVPALVGTPHGRLLLLKLSLLIPVLALAAINRRLIPALAGDADTVGRPAMRRLALQAGAELGCALGVLVVVAWMSVTPPARHVPPTWPLSFRLSYEATADLPGVRARVVAGAAVALLGAIGLGVALWRRRRRLALVCAALAAAVAGVVALPPLAVDAYPTTYQRPAVAYHALSITAGAEVFAMTCAACHAEGASDVTGPKTDRRTAGDLLWLITRGIPSARKPGFGDRLSEDARWDLVNFLRARSAGAAARSLGPTVEREPAPIVAPDFSYAVGPSPSHSLREYRAQRIVLLVLFTLPESRPRLAQLAQAYGTIGSFGAEVIAVPMRPDRDILKRLRGSPNIFYPVATEGAGEIVRAYSLFRPPDTAPRHAEFIIDRQGYIRARVTALPGQLPGLSSLLTQLETLNQEPQLLEPAAEHVH
jgi:putative copper resistance protein D